MRLACRSRLTEWRVVPRSRSNMGRSGFKTIRTGSDHGCAGIEALVGDQRSERLGKHGDDADHIHPQRSRRGDKAGVGTATHGRVNRADSRRMMAVLAGDLVVRRLDGSVIGEYLKGRRRKWRTSR
jgi:hypothetical protein